MDTEKNKPSGFIVGIVEAFLKGPLSILLIIAAIILGIIAISSTPREEEPQIVVPMADISVSFPGHTASEVEQLVTVPLEKLLWQIDGVEHVYSISRRGESFVTVRFYVGEDREDSIIKLRDKIEANRDVVPPGVKNWIVKPVEIDDVPIVTLTLFSDKLNSLELRRLAEELKTRIDRTRDISKSEILGGYKRIIQIEPNIEKMSARNVSINDIVSALQQNNTSVSAGTINNNNKTKKILVNNLLANITDIKKTVISNYDNKTIRVEDVATVTDGPEEPNQYLTLGFGPGSPLYDKYKDKRLNAVTLSFSKKKGTNAVSVAKNIINKSKSLEKKILPSDAHVLVTRNYGEIANDKVNGLMWSMFFAIVTVVILIFITMGWRESLVVGMAVPVSFALALFVNYLFGFTINRVTLFALILSLGLVVDDPITNVDNIQRHIKMGKYPPLLATLHAVKEVLPPVIMSTLAIIISFSPMFFITGMMGPYMGPMAINVPLTVTFSTLCALTFVPWLAYKLLKRFGRTDEIEVNTVVIDTTPKWIKKTYKYVLSPFLVKSRAYILLVVIFLLLCISGLLLVAKVPLKMLPYDNKDELQLIVDMPEGTSLEKTDRVVQKLEAYLKTVKEVTDFESYTGVNSPIDFNGLVRHYNFRRRYNFADIRINLLPKNERSMQSHAIALRIRKTLTEIAEANDAKLSIVEVPPGPPVISTITAEVTGEEYLEYSDLIDASKKLQATLKEVDPIHIVQIDDMSETPHDRIDFIPDREKIAVHRLTADSIFRTIKNSVGGNDVNIAHFPNERNPLLINVKLSLKDRSDIGRLKQLWLKDGRGKMVQLSELGSFKEVKEEQPIYHKNLERVVFVTAESVGRPPGELIISSMFKLNKKPLPKGINVEWAGEGEWEITLRVLRDLSIAFGVALIGIYLLMTIQMRSFLMPTIVMMSIPLTIIGIAPGFYILNLIAGKNVGLYPDPIFFTATAMIGMIALGGIVIRNSIVLIEFIQGALAEGKSLNEALLESGAVRFRPIVLTALTTMLGAWPITFDPVFSGLAWSLIFGMISSTVFTLVLIPVIYMLIGPKTIKN